MAEKKNNTLRRTIWILVLLALAGGIAIGLKSPPVPVRTAPAQQGPIRAFVEEQAKTILPRIYEITMPQDGRVQPIALEPGMPVKQGEVVARIDVRDLQDASLEADAMVVAMSNAVASSQAKLRASQAYEAVAKWLWTAQDKLYAENNVSEQSMKESERDYIGTQVDAEQDRFMFHAMAAIGAVSRLYPIYIERRLQWAVMTSPIDGIVLKRHEQNEKALPAGAPLLDIGDPEGLQVAADILSEDATHIKPGQAVEVFGPSIGDVPLKGVVLRVDPRGFTKTSSLGVEEQRVTVTITLADGERARLRAAGRDLGVDYRVRVRIFTAAADEAVTIPITALFRDDHGQWQVFAVREGRADVVPVSIGLMNDQQAQVINGIRGGEEVIVAPDAGLKPGARIHPI